MFGIVTDKLIRYWHYNEGLANNVWRSMLNADHKIILTGASKSTDGIYFDGVDDYGQMTHPEISNTSLTVEIMVTLINPSKSGYSTILGENGNTKFGIFNSDLVPLVRFNSEGGLYHNKKIEWSKKSHLVYVYDSVDKLDKLYVNGIFSGSKTSNTSVKIPSILDLFSGFIATGDIHYLRMYSKALTLEEISQNYLAGIDVGLPKNPPNAVTNLRTILVSGNVVNINWDLTAYTSSYIITRNGTQIAEVYSGNYRDTGLNKNSTYIYEVIAKNDIGVSTPTSLSVTTENTNSVSIFEDFEDTDLNFIFTGDWTMVTNVSTNTNHSGVGALRSKVISNSSKSISTFQLNIPIDAINIKFQFKYKVSSEQRWDKFTVSIDSVKVINEVSGEIDWTTYSNTSLTAGTHTVTLEYAKDTSSSGGSDLVYIDDIELMYDTIDPTPSLPPTVLSVIASKLIISDELNMNQSIITVQFDKDVTQYVARLNGIDHNTGALVHDGGSVIFGENAEIVVDWNELSSEGENRINIYGKDANGLWTPYIT